MCLFSANSGKREDRFGISRSSRDGCTDNRANGKMVEIVSYRRVTRVLSMLWLIPWSRMCALHN